MPYRTIGTKIKKKCYSENYFYNSMCPSKVSNFNTLELILSWQSPKPKFTVKSFISQIIDLFDQILDSILFYFQPVNPLVQDELV